METTWLARFLIKQREIIEAAETPFAKLAIFILPVLAPSIPATFTGLHIFKLLLNVFDFTYARSLSVTLAILVGIVLELLGYVGAISFIQSVFRWIRYRRDEQLLPAVLNGLSYLFYLIAMFLINVQLGKYFQTPTIINNIVGLLSFITVPTGLLAANHLSQKEDTEIEATLRQEKREDSLKKYKIKHGINPDAVYQQTTPQIVSNHKASDYKDYVFELLNNNITDLLNDKGEISLTKITVAVNRKKRVGLVHSAVKGTWYKYIQEWKRGRQ